MGHIALAKVHELVEYWESLAARAEELAPNVPLSTLVLEGFELACFIERYWEPDEPLGLPGLKEYVRAQFTENIASGDPRARVGRCRASRALQRGVRSAAGGSE